jgi:hypothetical protein
LLGFLHDRHARLHHSHRNDAKHSKLTIDSYVPASNVILCILRSTSSTKYFFFLLAWLWKWDRLDRLAECCWRK